MLARQILSKTMDSTTLTPDKVELSSLAVNAETGLVRALSGPLGSSKCRPAVHKVSVFVSGCALAGACGSVPAGPHAWTASLQLRAVRLCSCARVGSGRQ